MHSTLVHINTGGLFNRTRNSPHTNTTLQERRNPRKQIKGRYLSESTMSRIEITPYENPRNMQNTGSEMTAPILAPVWYTQSPCSLQACLVKTFSLALNLLRFLSSLLQLGLLMGWAEISFPRQVVAWGVFV
jgi:hypothetical protein